MGYNYNMNVRVEIPFSVYTKLAQIGINEGEENWGQKADPDQEKQYVWINHPRAGLIYLHRYEVTQYEGIAWKEKEMTFLSINTAGLKWCESMTLSGLQENIINTKAEIEAICRENGYDRYFKLDELDLCYAEQESPYMQ